MRIIIIAIILLTSAICSCKSHKHAVSNSYVGVAIDSMAMKESAKSDDALSLINSASDFDIKGITVEFYRPDSAVAGMTASPKSIVIESITAKHNTNTARHEVSTVVVSDSVRFMSDMTTATASDTESKKEAFKPSSIVSWLSIAIVVLVSGLFIYNNFKRK